MSKSDVEAHPLSDDVLEEDIAILGKKGSGKTYTAKGVVERLLGRGDRVLILDPLGLWWGLRSSADGQDAGFKVAVIGGEHADMPLDPAAAVPLADIVAHENVPMVLDVSDLSKSAQQSFLLAFLRELRRINRDPLTIVLEEADVFAPQNPMKDDSAALLGEIDWISRRGRFRGFRLVSITQRPAKINKDVLTQASTLILHKLPAPQDKAAAKAWIDGNGDAEKGRAVIDSLATLPVGEAWIWSTIDGELRRAKFPAIATLDTSATPKAGERRIEAKALASIDLAKVREALASVLAPKDRDGKRKSEKQKQTVVATDHIRPALPDPKVIEEAERRGYVRGRESLLPAFNATLSRFEELRAQIDGISESVGLSIQWLSVQRGDSDPAQAAADAIARASRPREIAMAPKAPTRQGSAAPPAHAGDRSLGAERRPLAVLARVYPAGMTEAQWSVAAGMKRSGGTWGTYKSRLRTAGMIEQRGDLWFARPDALIAIGQDIEPMPAPGDALVEFWISKISGVGPMLRELARVYPQGYARTDLATALDMAASGGTFGTYLSRLRSAGLIEDRGGLICAAHSLVEE